MHETIEEDKPKIYRSDEFLSGDSDGGEDVFIKCELFADELLVSDKISDTQALLLIYQASVASIVGPNPVEDVMSYNPDMYILGMHMVDEV
jgi:hypothetical protein